MSLPPSGSIVPRPENGKRIATVLDAFSAFWKFPAKPAPTDLNPTDGLQEVRERLWAEDNGLTAVEFTVGGEIAFSLLERGIPFVAHNGGCRLQPFATRDRQ